LRAEISTKAVNVGEQKYDWQLARIDERGDIEFE
jgi:hypothetical protein